MASFLNNKSAKWNIFSNYGGNVSTAVISLLFIPVYIRFLGIEAYGIIGFFLMIQGLLSFLDMGLGIAINRDMARHLDDETQIGYLNNLAYSLMIIYWIMGILICLLILCFSPYFSHHWFNDSHLSPALLQKAFWIMSVTIAVRWPYSIYSSALRGMRLQVLLNLHDFVWNLVKSVGSWLTLLWGDHSLLSFLLFQGICILCQTLSLHFIFWYKLPRPETPKRFDVKVIKSIGRYAAGMGIASIIGSIVYQLDKLIISKMVTIEQFGYYTLATNIAMLVYNVSLPIYMAMFPSFTALVHKKQMDAVKTQFHFYSRLVAGLIIPVSAVIFFFAREVLLVWTKNPTLASNTAPLLQILIIGTSLNALMVMPHTLLLANNRVRFMLYSHIIAAVCIIPLISGAIYLYGVKGGAWAVALLYAGYFFIQAAIIIRQNLEKNIANWYIKDNFLFIGICAAFLLPVSLFSHLDSLSRFPLAFSMAFLWAVCTGVCMLSINPVRMKLFNSIPFLKNIRGAAK